MSKTILVTGASGFVGRHTLAPLVEQGYRVHAVASHEPPIELQNLSGTVWHRRNLLVGTDRAQLIANIRPSHLLHLAWVTEHGLYWDAPENDAWVAASTDLVGLAVAAGCHRVVAAGTCAEYGWTDPALLNADCIEMTTACMPTTFYGRSKLRFQRWLTSPQNVSTAWGRLFLVYGIAEERRRLVASAITSLLAGRVVKVGPGTQVRDFLDTRDAGAAFAALIDSPIEGPVNVASGIGQTIAEVVITIGDLIGRRDLIELGALPARPDEPPRLVGDITRLRHEVGFQPLYALADGLAHTIAWWRSIVRLTNQ